MKKRWIQQLVRILLAPLLRFYYRLRLEGDFSVFNSPKVMVVANHESLLDGLLLGLFLPGNPVFVVYTGLLKNRWYRLALSVSDYLKVDPKNPMAMKSVIHLLAKGRPVVMFAEGRITTTGSLMKVYPGPAYAAAKSDAVIVPVCLSGTIYSQLSFMSAPHPRHWRPKISLSVQPPRRIKLESGIPAKQARHKAGEALRRILQEAICTARLSQGTLPLALLEAMRIFGRRRVILEDIKAEYRYADLLKIALILGRLLSRRTELNERIGVMLPNLGPCVSLLFGLNVFNRTPAFLNYSAGNDALRSACRGAKLKLVVTSRAFIELAGLQDKINALTTALPEIRLLYLEDLRAEIRLTDKLWLLAALLSPQRVVQAQDTHQEAVVLFSSGSEGQPKGVVLSHRALLANVSQLNAVAGFSVQDHILSALPLFHAFGLMTGALLPLLSGFRVLLYPSPLHYRVIPELAYDADCSILVGTSTFLAHYAKHAHTFDFQRMRLVIAGAEKLSETVRKLWFDKFGIRIYEGYGATETAPVIAVNTPLASKSGTVGEILPGIEAQLLPVPGIEPGGALHVRGPNVMSGYLRSDNPGVLQPPVSPLGEGWYDTGDIAELDDEGFLHITGRIKRFVKIAGEMLSLEIVESIGNTAARREGLECTCAAIAQSDPSRGERVILCVSGPAPSLAALKAAVRELGAPEIALPREIALIESLPLLGSGKVDYPALKTWYEQRKACDKSA